MTPNFRNSSELLQHALQIQLYRKLLKQLEKDFGLANIAIDFRADIKPEGLTTMLHEKIYYLILEKFADYLNLMYVIDVPEKAFKEIKVTDVVEVAEQVAFLILKREWQKVWSKVRYSQK